MANSGSTRGGTPDQHAKAGAQSHKNTGGSDTKSSGSRGAGQGQVKDPKHDGRLKENR